MNRSERLALVDHDDPDVPVVTQCRLLKVARSTLYYRPVPVSSDDLAVMRRMDELHLAWPFYGSGRMAAVLRREGWPVNRKRAKRLMRVMGIEAIYQKPNTSKGHPDHQVYPYLLRGLIIDRRNQVWCADITYVPMAKGFVYLAAVMDRFSLPARSRFGGGRPAGSGVEVVDHHGDGLLYRGAAGSDGAVWPAEDFQHGPGCATHQRRVRGRIGEPGCSDQHGRQRAVSGQYFHRTTVAEPEI